MNLKPGDRVRLTKACVERMREATNKYDDTDDGNNLVDDLEGQVGVVLGPWEGLEDVPELDVRWEPHGLRYGFHPDDLECISE